MAHEHGMVMDALKRAAKVKPKESDVAYFREPKRPKDMTVPMPMMGPPSLHLDSHTLKAADKWQVGDEVALIIGATVEGIDSMGDHKMCRLKITEAAHLNGGMKGKEG